MSIRRGIQYRPGSGWYFFNECKEVSGDWSQLLAEATVDSFQAVERMIEREQAAKERTEQ
jgi:hypothetical protein